MFRKDIHIQCKECQSASIRSSYVDSFELKSLDYKKARPWGLGFSNEMSEGEDFFSLRKYGVGKSREDIFQSNFFYFLFNFL